MKMSKIVNLHFFLDAEELFLVIHNIDGSMLRVKKVSLHSV